MTHLGGGLAPREKKAERKHINTAAKANEFKDSKFFLSGTCGYAYAKF